MEEHAKDLPMEMKYQHWGYLIWVAKMSATLKRKELINVPFHLKKGKTGRTYS